MSERVFPHASKEDISMATEISRRDMLTEVAIAAAMAALPLSGRTSTTFNAMPILLENGTELPPINVSAIAERIVQTLQPKPNERAVMVFEASYYPELAEAVQLLLYGAKVHPVIPLNFEPTAIARQGLAGWPPDPADKAQMERFRQRQSEWVRALQPLFDQSDLFLWMPVRVYSPDRRWEHLVASSRVRGIHFHWMFFLNERSTEEVRVLSRIYERALLETDYNELSNRQDKLIAAIRGQPLRLTTRSGTDLRVRVPQDAWFHKNDGDMSLERAHLARAPRDREMELPAGALRFIPHASSAEGRLVVRDMLGAEDVALEFSEGRVTSISARSNEDECRARFERYGDVAKHIGEIVLGTNPLLTGDFPCDEVYFGYGSGCLRVSLGHNWESGGTLFSAVKDPIWLFPEHATLVAGNKILVDGGRLVE